ncbi:hypothetical protein DFP90_103412 [Aestuariispira insulae]|uniref:Uncharacterized protein n=1 Tax=Aestuariispira insulae TaxID=1461337 RepID=A0A3D9HQ84_9PROT|nr:hypothetical protein DFP90_103412 [Aestuariispira insulae]
MVSIANATDAAPKTIAAEAATVMTCVRQLRFRLKIRFGCFLLNSLMVLFLECV